MDAEISDLVDEHFRPFVRALGNLVITFALAEAVLLDLVAEMRDQDELKAVAVLKAPDAKAQVLALAGALGLTGYDRDGLLTGLESFWADKAERNRLVHDEWYPSLYQLGTVNTRGLTRTKTPQEVFGSPDVAEVWRLAGRFQYYDGLFSHRAHMIRCEREAAADRGDGTPGA